MKTCLLTLVLVLCMGAAQAQSDIEITEEKKLDFYLSIQSNQLIKQLINLGGGSSTIDNPYLINFSVNSRKNGSGFNIGLGNVYSKTIDEPDEDNNEGETTNNDFSLRLGWDIKKDFGKRWLFGGGVDLLIHAAKVENFSSFTREAFVNSDLSVDLESTTETLSKSNSIGFGPRATIGYRLSDRVYLSTEASYYYLATTVESTFTSEMETIEVLSFDVFDINTEREEFEDTSKTRSMSISIPVIVNLMIKF